MKKVNKQEIVSYYLKSELARLFEKCDDDNFWREFDNALSRFLREKGSEELERLVAGLSSSYRNNPGLYRKIFDKREPPTNLPRELPNGSKECCEWYYVELPVDVLKIPNLRKDVMQIVLRVDRDISKFINWVDKHPDDNRVETFRKVKPLRYEKILAIYRPNDNDVPSEVEFWIIDGVHRVISMARSRNLIPVYLCVPKRHIEAWEKRYKEICGMQQEECI